MPRVSLVVNTLALILCRAILPLLTIVLLLLLPDSGARPWVSDSRALDWAIRLVLAAFFCINYWYLPRLFEPKPGKWLWISIEMLRDPVLLKGYYLFNTVGYSVSAALLTLYAFATFGTALRDYLFLAAGANGCIFLVSFILRYRAFMQLVAIQQR